MQRLLVLSFALLVLVLAACQPNDESGMMGDNPQGDYQETRQDQNMNRNQGNDPMNVNDRDNNMTRQAENLNQNNRNQDQMNRQNQEQNRYDVAGEAADEVARQVDDIDEAYVMTGDNNAYVAVVMNNDSNTNVSDDVKKEVSRVVQSTKPDLDNVYVSANPDFFDMVNSYTERASEGDPIDGFFEEFNGMLDRVFPDLER
ncbi:YhcN/YlaJ family sporulation lipoprotein [Alkalibacillus flavidus]|uniref:YhcN/YlaJ family sporulation lipoprotein n=1 Tax=Alkalibacillus flavidus TaxID=546021 RepID=A0ABV2KW04_9BACI